MKCDACGGFLYLLVRNFKGSDYCNCLQQHQPLWHYYPAINISPWTCLSFVMAKIHVLKIPGFLVPEPRPPLIGDFMHCIYLCERNCDNCCNFNISIFVLQSCCSKHTVNVMWDRTECRFSCTDWESQL